MRHPPINTPYTHDAAVSVLTASTAIQTAKQRKYLSVVNKSTNPLSIVWLNCAGDAAVVGVGIPIGAGVVWTPQTPPTGAIAGISESGTASVVVTWG